MFIGSKRFSINYVDEYYCISVDIVEFDGCLDMIDVRNYNCYRGM